jgi:hypothetical protein
MTNSQGVRRWPASELVVVGVFIVRAFRQRRRQRRLRGLSGTILRRGRRRFVDQPLRTTPESVTFHEGSYADPRSPVVSLRARAVRQVRAGPLLGDQVVRRAGHRRLHPLPALPQRHRLVQETGGFRGGASEPCLYLQ